MCIFGIFHLVNCAPKDPYKGNLFLSPSLCLACDFRTVKRHQDGRRDFPQHTPQNLILMIYRPVCRDQCASGMFPASVTTCQGAVSTDTALVGAPRLSTSWRKAGQKFSVKFPLRWHLIIAPPSAVSHLFAPLYEHSWLPKIWKSLSYVLLVQWLLKRVQTDDAEQGFTKSAVWGVTGAHSPSSTSCAFSPVRCNNMDESKPLRPKLRGCSCTGQWWT